MVVTAFFAGQLKANDFEAFLRKLSDYLNVNVPVMKEHYNRHSVLKNNVEVQQVVNQPQFDAVQSEVNEVNNLIGSVLDGRTSAVTMSEKNGGRPIRTTIEDEQWKEQLEIWESNHRDIVDQRTALLERKKTKEQK